MAYEVVMSYHLHMPSYFLGTFTEYPYVIFIYQLHVPSYFLETFTECFFLGTEYTDFTEK